MASAAPPSIALAVAPLPPYFPAPFDGASPPAPREPWRVLDLFSGVGGMSWGFASLPSFFRVVGAIDAERAKPGRGRSSGTSTRCNASYAANLGVTPLAADLATLDPRTLPPADVLISCAPCTGFSQKMAVNHVADDARNRLVPRTAEFVEAVQPRVLVMENVRELLTGRHRHHFDLLRSRLEALGYGVWAGVHDLSDFGLPQRRRRALVVAARGEAPAPLVVPAPARRTTVRDAIGGLPPVEQGEAHPADEQHRCPRHTAAVTERLRAIPRDGGSWGDLVDTRPDLLIPSMVGKRAGSFPDIYGRLWWDRPAITITRECGSPGNGRYVHPEQDRMLTVREMALLQGFPPGYRFLGPLAARYNQIGDAVPPLVARRVAGHVAQHLAAAGAQRSVAA